MDSNARMTFESVGKMDSNAPMNPDDRNGVLRENHLVKSVILNSPYDETSVSVRRTLGHIWTLSGHVDLRLKNVGWNGVSKNETEVN